MYFEFGDSRPTDSVLNKCHLLLKRLGQLLQGWGLGSSLDLFGFRDCAVGSPWGCSDGPEGKGSSLSEGQASSHLHSIMQVQALFFPKGPGGPTPIKSLEGSLGCSFRANLSFGKAGGICAYRNLVIKSCKYKIFKTPRCSSSI